jgi:hypothetical protein
MAKVGKHTAGVVSEDSVPSLKSRGLKNPMPQSYELTVGYPNMANDNDALGKQETAPASYKKAPGLAPGEAAPAMHKSGAPKHED